MSGHRGAPSAENMIVNRIVVGARTYELRYNRCGKPNCKVCYGLTVEGRGRPGHGPYWYLVVSTRRGIRRSYIGRELDTTKHIGADGAIQAVVRAKQPPAPAPNPTPQTTLPY